MKGKALKRLLRSVTARSILDVGCDSGLNGYVASELLPSVESLDGFDLNPQAIRTARGLGTRSRPGVRCRHWVGDIDHESLDETYDLVLYIDCLQYAADPDFLLRQIAKCLSRGGRLILYAPVSDGISVSVPPWVRARLPDWSSLCRSYTRADLLRVLAVNGFRAEHVEWVGKYGYRLYKTWEYWLRSHSVSLSYLFSPIGWALAVADRRQAGPGSGVFVVAMAADAD